MERVRKYQWRLVKTPRLLVDIDLTSWTVGFDFVPSFGIYLGPLVIDIRKRYLP